MNVYQTDKNGFLVGQDIADEDPRNPGSYLIPGNCTSNVPPALSVNETAQLLNGTWTIVPDFRGKVYWLADGSRHEITEAGIAPPVGFLDVEPPKPLSVVQGGKIASLVGSRDAAIVADVTVDGVVYPADDKFKTYVSRILNQAGRGKPIPSGDLIRAKDRSKPIVTVALLNKIEDTITTQEAAVWSKFNSLVDQVLAATDAVTVEAIVW